MQVLTLDMRNGLYRKMKNAIWIQIIKNKYFRFFSSIKFAIPILFLFSLGMILGTIAESKYGTIYAGKAVYHSWWFYLIQFCIAISLLFAMLVRFPIQKRLYGFYLVHISLLIIMSGSVITRYHGIDGAIQLKKEQPNNIVHLSDAVIHISSNDNVRTVKLPPVTKPTELNETSTLVTGAKITFKQYLPYAKPLEEWRDKPGAWMAQWKIKNTNFEQEVEIGNEFAGDIENKIELGPLRIEALEERLTQDLEKVLSGAHRGFILINVKNGHLRPIADPLAGLKFNEDGRSVMIRMPEEAKKKMSFFEFKVGDDHFIFFPEYSSLPLIGHLKTDVNSDYRLLNVSELAGKNTIYISLLTSGAFRLVIGKDKSWKTQIVNQQNFETELPWMGFKITLNNKILNKTKEFHFIEDIPQKEDEKNIAVVNAIVELNGKSEEIWLNNKEKTYSSVASADLFIGPSQIKLPMTLTLEKFVMEMIPGTDRPASYESTVKVLDNRLGSDSEKQVKIFMNNPYKSDGYTFYQSSYFQDDKGEYYSVLSVNKDPGRSVKYAGALLLVFALVLHFMIIYGKIRL